MPAFLAMLIGALITAAGTIAGKVLIGLGISVVTITGVQAGLSWAMSNVVSSFAGLPAEMSQLIAALGVGEFISIIASAITARMFLNGLTGDSIKKWVLK